MNIEQGSDMPVSDVLDVTLDASKLPVRNPVSREDDFKIVPMASGSMASQKICVLEPSKQAQTNAPLFGNNRDATMDFSKHPMQQGLVYSKGVQAQDWQVSNCISNLFVHHSAL